jgi:hypothetical protein
VCGFVQMTFPVASWSVRAAGFLSSHDLVGTGPSLSLFVCP